MNAKKIAIFILILLTSAYVQAASVDVTGLNDWVLTKKAKEPTARADCKKLLEDIMQKSLNKSEFTVRPNDPITREEMALMLVSSLGYEGAAKTLDNNGAPYQDVKSSKGAITIMKDLKLMSGDNAAVFNPKKVLTNEEVAAIIQRAADKLNTPLSEIHSSYAIKSSQQMDAIKNIDAVSFGWSQVQYDTESKKAVVNTSGNNKNEFNLPGGFEEPLAFAKQAGAETYLMVYLNNKSIQELDGTLAHYIFSNEQRRAALIQEILKASQTIAAGGNIDGFDGITIDFENFYEAALKAEFNIFLAELKAALAIENKKLIVAVQPTSYFKGYDYKTIGMIADRIILMAHDYAPKTLSAGDMQAGLTVTPIITLDAVYKALKEITGSSDPDKVMLQISFASTQWQIKDNKIINQQPFTPSYDKIFARLQSSSTKISYSDIYQNPYAVYEDGGIKNVIWYENEQSVKAKIELAKMFGVNKISLWRLGTIPSYASSTRDTIRLNVLSQVISR